MTFISDDVDDSAKLEIDARVTELVPATTTLTLRAAEGAGAAAAAAAALPPEPPLPAERRTLLAVAGPAVYLTSAA